MDRSACSHPASDRERREWARPSSRSSLNVSGFARMLPVTMTTPITTSAELAEAVDARPGGVRRRPDHHRRHLRPGRRAGARRSPRRSPSGSHGRSSPRPRPASTGSACTRSATRSSPRDETADGRARTFLPLVPDTQAAVRPHWSSRCATRSSTRATAASPTSRAGRRRCDGRRPAQPGRLRRLGRDPSGQLAGRPRRTRHRPGARGRQPAPLARRHDRPGRARRRRVAHRPVPTADRCPATSRTSGDDEERAATAHQRRDRSPARPG